jgi:hypothetical protein
LKVHRNRCLRRFAVTTDGENLVSHAGAALLAELADRTGLTLAMSRAMADCGISWNTHDPGVILTHLAVTIADGGDCLSDMAVLRNHSELFGPVASNTTAWRAVRRTTSVELARIPQAVAAARAVAWKDRPAGEGIVIDFDATLVTSHAENKEDAAPTYKRGFGFHPLAAWCDTTREPLAGVLRPGNAGANDSEDHLVVLDDAISALPPAYQAGHQPGDDPGLVVHPILVRVDSAGASHLFVDGLTEANIEYSIGHRVDAPVREALLLAQEEDWSPAVETDGNERDGAAVIELTALMDLSSWGEGTRLICRRERPHPGAQLSLFDMFEGFRHTCFITNSGDGQVASLELRHRGHARVEDRVRCWKECGLSNLPFDTFPQNETWVAASLVAGALIAWAQMNLFDGELAKAEPKTLRFRIFHVAALLVRRQRGLVLRIDRAWPWAGELGRAFHRLRSAFP